MLSSLSTQCLTETAMMTQKPHVAHALRHAFYVDDFLGGADSLEEAQQLIFHEETALCL